MNISNIERLAKIAREHVEKVPATVIKRVKADGRGARGKFSAYSTGWAKKRRQKGLQTGNKDFWYDGKMWGSFQIIKEKVGDSSVVFELGTTDGKSRKGSLYLSDIHSDNEGELIIDITEDEWDKLTDDIFEEWAKGIEL